MSLLQEQLKGKAPGTGKKLMKLLKEMKERSSLAPKITFLQTGKFICFLVSLCLVQLYDLSQSPMQIFALSKYFLYSRNLQIMYILE